MKLLINRHCVVAVISLLLCVIWHVPVSAAVTPKYQSLGRLRGEMYSSGRLDVDGQGNLYVADGRRQMVHKFDKYGKQVAAFTGAYPTYANGLAVSPDGSKLYVCGKTMVTILDGRDGSVQGRLVSAAHPTGEGEFIAVGEIDLDASGYIVVVDAGAVKLRVYNPEGVFQYEFGGLGMVLGTGQLGSGKFRSIWAMAINAAAGEIYVADNQNFAGSTPNIQVFDLAGVWKRTYKQQSFGVPPLAMYAGICFDNAGRGYFLDSIWENIRVLSLPSTVLLPSFGTSGYGVGQLANPYDVIFDPLTSRLFVSVDSGRVEVFGIDGGQNPVQLNNAPGQPLPLSPVSGSEVASAQPLLSWQNASDPDSADVLTYNVRVSRTGEADLLLGGVTQGAENSSVAVTTTLSENALYSWSVQAYDGTDLSAFSESQSFYVNAVQEAPTAPVVGETAAVADGATVLSWSSASDPDPFDSVSYVLQVAAAADFATSLIDAPVDGLTATLGDLQGYADLVDGASYFWRVLAVDNHGLTTASVPGTFVYDTTLLSVTANMPGATISLGGNLGYAGRAVGTAPLQLRDVALGTLSVVVERSGFEPWVGQITVGERQNVSLHAVLVPALVPVELKARPLEVNGLKITAGADVVPFAIDYDNDGYIDLLTGESSGKLTLYRGVAADLQPAFTSGVPLLTAPAGAAPVVVDWNNDGKKDLLVGTGAGAVVVYLNNGTEEAPAFGVGTALSAAGAPLNVGATAIPAVLDLDGDGDKDLVVGSASGAVHKFLNLGSDAAPELAAASTLLAPLSGNAAPSFVDWDGDGDRDLLIATSQHIFVCLQQVDRSFVASGVLSVADELNGKKGSAATGSGYLGDRLRVFAYDAEGQKGKDLLVGTAAGDVRFVRANGSDYVATFAPALLEKITEIEMAAAEAGVELPAALSVVKTALATGDIASAKKGMARVDLVAPAIVDLVEELRLLLQ